MIPRFRAVLPRSGAGGNTRDTPPSHSMHPSSSPRNVPGMSGRHQTPASARPQIPAGPCTTRHGHRVAAHKRFRLRVCRSRRGPWPARLLLSFIRINPAGKRGAGVSYFCSEITSLFWCNCISLYWLKIWHLSRDALFTVKQTPNFEDFVPKNVN